jgi:hypothetical protein
MPVDPTGVAGPTRARARGREWRQTTRGLYVPAWVDPDVPEQRILEQSMLLPPYGAVTGWAACRLFRGNFFDGLLPDGRTRMPVPLCIGPQLHRPDRPGVRWCRDRLHPDDVVVRHGVRCVREQRAVFDAMRMASDVREATVAMDMAAAAEITSISRMEKYVDEHPRWNGAPQVRAALALADENSWSPNETRTRLVWELDAGLPRPLTNKPVWDRHGRLLGYADLLDVEAGVVGEYDGADHRPARRQSKDVDREGGFRDCGLEVYRVTAPDLHDRPLVVERMRSTRGRARWLPEGRRPWTIEPPPGWEEEPPLDVRLELRDFRRWEPPEHWEPPG